MKVLFFLTCATFAAITAGVIYQLHSDREVLTVAVLGKERVPRGQSSRYLVYSEHLHGTPEVLEVTDSIFEGLWDSSDRYASLKTGSCYRVEVYGWRLPLLSMYRNVVDVVPHECPIR